MVNYSVHNDLLYNDCGPVQQIDHNQKKYNHGSNICDYIVYHFTASGTMNSAHNTHLRKNVSWHLTIDTDGKIYQLYDFRKRCWHAGRSSWKKPDGTPIDGLNSWAIGIEIINVGPVFKKSDGSFIDSYDNRIPIHQVYEEELGVYWQKYTDEQIETALLITPALIEAYNVVDVLGHEEISPGRKIDPGPAFRDTLQELKQMC